MLLPARVVAHLRWSAACRGFGAMKPSTALFALVVVGAGACTDDASPVEDTGLQLTMHATIPAATELEYCKFVEIPDAWVTRDHIEFTEGSHHVLVYQTSYTAIPTQKDDGTPVDTSGNFDCTGGPTSGWSITKLIGGSQNRDGSITSTRPTTRSRPT
jgi:hypothetical protein